MMTRKAANDSLLLCMMLLLFMAAPWNKIQAFAFSPQPQPRIRGSCATDIRATPAKDQEESEDITSTFNKRKKSLWSSLQKFLWPGAQPDPNVSPEQQLPLPPGSLGCPFLGSDSFLSGNKKDGPGFFFKQASARVGHPSVYKFYFWGTPVASVSGAKQYKKLCHLEFSSTEALSPTYNDGNSNGAVDEHTNNNVPTVFGNDNMMFERNKERHALLRRLVGSGMTPAAAKESFPIIQQMAQQRVQNLLLLQQQSSSSKPVVSLETVCTEYTMDITQAQILGLQLPPDEVPTFRQKLTVWLKALYSPIANLDIPWIIQHIPEYKARKYMEAKIQDRIDILLEHGPDASVLSNMVFAVDDDDDDEEKEQGIQLSRKQVVENALLLAITGSETTSGTLTYMMLLLGLHPGAYQKLVQEQIDIQAKFGKDIMTPEILDDKHCPYLNAVLKETMRMGPMTGKPMRASETISMDGVQIPQGWTIFNNIRLTHQLDPVSRLPDDSHMDPHTGFHPERWFSAATTPSDFIPFGAGPRYCIGSYIATLQMQVFLATLSRSVESFSLASDHKPIVWNPSTLMPRPLDGVQIHSIKAL